MHVLSMRLFLFQADAKLYIDDILGEWYLPPKISKTVTRQLFDNINWCIDHYKELTANARVTTIACGAAHSVVLTESGHAWACGHFAHGQLGLGTMFQVLATCILHFTFCIEYFALSIEHFAFCIEHFAILH